MIHAQLLMMLEVWESHSQFVHISTTESRHGNSRGQYIATATFPETFHNLEGLAHFQSRMGKRAADAAVLHRLATIIMLDNTIFYTLAKTNELKQ